MKINIVFFIAVILIISLPSYSQKKVEFGLYLGTSGSNMSGVDKIEAALTDALTEAAGKDFPISKSARSFRFNAGGFLAYNFSPSIALKGGVEYAPKGENFDGELYGETDIYTFTNDVLLLNATLNLAYVEFPISVQFSTQKKDSPEKTYYYLSLGLSPALKVVSKQEVSVRMVERGFDNYGLTEEPIGETQYDSTELEGLSSSDLGGVCSIGVCAKNLFLDLKYERGLKNILANSNEGNIKNNMLALYLGYKF
jgi:hypothetical protein